MTEAQRVQEFIASQFDLAAREEPNPTVSEILTSCAATVRKLRIPPAPEPSP